MKNFVGPEEKLYSLSRDLIAYYSPYFAACLKNNWKEANEGVLRLLDDNLNFFDVLCDYFRSGEATLAPNGHFASNLEWKETLKKCFEFIRFTDM